MTSQEDFLALTVVRDGVRWAPHRQDSIPSTDATQQTDASIR